MYVARMKLFYHLIKNKNIKRYYERRHYHRYCVLNHIGL